MNSEFFLDVLEGNNHRIPIFAEAIIAKRHPDKKVHASNGLDLNEYQRLGLCSTSPCSVPRPSGYWSWGGEKFDQLLEQHNVVVWEVDWQGHSLEIVHLEWESG